MTTILQIEMINAIATDELTPLNGGEPTSHKDATTYADCIINTNQDKGVFASLLNAGLVWHSGSGRDATLGLTEAGFTRYKFYSPF